MPYQNIKLAIQDNVAVLTLDAPEVLNALSSAMVTEISSAISAVSHPRSEARCLLMTATGRAFCAGANLQTAGLTGTSKPAGHVLETHYNPVMNKLRNLSIPFVTAVNGVAAGVGMSFAMMGDIVVAAESAYFLQAFANIGLIPDGGATWLLPRLIGWGRALELSMLAEKLSAEKAAEWGIVNRVVKDDALMDEAMKLARRLAHGPMSLGLIRKAYWASLENSFSQQLQLETDLQVKAGNSQDAKEGIASFLEKRPPEFTGQ